MKHAFSAHSCADQKHGPCTRQEKRLDVFHLRCLRKILGITWSDRITNTEILEQVNLQSMTTILCKRRLRWLGHVRRMDDTRIPKQLLYGELAQGKRQRGRPKLGYKDTCKISLSRCDIGLKSWEETAEDKTTWKTAVKEGTVLLENSVINNQIEKRQCRSDNHRNSERCGTSLISTCASNIGRIGHERSCKRGMSHL